jgi:hypothetical protein
MLEKQPGLRDLWESILMRHNPDYLAKMLQSRAATSIAGGTGGKG